MRKFFLRCVGTHPCFQLFCYTETSFVTSCLLSLAVWPSQKLGSIFEGKNLLLGDMCTMASQCKWLMLISQYYCHIKQNSTKCSLVPVWPHVALSGVFLVCLTLIHTSICHMPQLFLCTVFTLNIRTP